MNERRTLHRLRGLLFGLAVVLFLGTVAELLLAGHTDDAVQLIPFALCGLGLVIVVAAWAHPRRPVLLALRLVVLPVAGGSLFGIAQHFLANRGFAQETRPDASAVTLVREALTGGVPLLAPGILAVAAVVALLALATTSGYDDEVSTGGSSPEDRRGPLSLPAGASTEALRRS